MIHQFEQFLLKFRRPSVSEWHVRRAQIQIHSSSHLLWKNFFLDIFIFYKIPSRSNVLIKNHSPAECQNRIGKISSHSTTLEQHRVAIKIRISFCMLTATYSYTHLKSKRTEILMKKFIISTLLKRFLSKNLANALTSKKMSCLKSKVFWRSGSRYI